MKKKILYISSSRADFGIAKNLLIKIKKDKNFSLSILATGSHYSKIHGLTYTEILKSNLNINHSIKLDLNSIDTSFITSKIISDLKNILINEKPDICIILGDRYELLGAALACFLNKIPVAHIHGGEKTFGAIDDSIRHCISKLSFLHLVTNNLYKKRLIQLGEDKNHIFNVGGLGAENISKIKFEKIEKTLKKYKIDNSKKYFLITYHSETFNSKNDLKNLKSLFDSLKLFESNYQLIFTSSNFDENGNTINRYIKQFIKSNKKNRMQIKSFGHNDYLNIAKNSVLVIGNSSSGILEIPSLYTPTLNIGIRQSGRVQGKSVYNSNFTKNQIVSKIRLCLKLKLKKTLNYNPYFKKNTSSKIIKLLKKPYLIKYMAKDFKDL